MTDSSEFANDADPGPDPDFASEGWSGSDIEEAYLKALQAMGDVPWVEGTSAPEADQPASSATAATNAVMEEEGSRAAEPSPAEDAVPTDGGSVPTGESVAVTADAPATPEPANAAPAAGPRLAKGTGRAEQESAEQRLNVSPEQVIEAALFVGGGPLTTRKICGFLRGSYSTRDVEQIIDKLNDDYVAQSRPYEIRLGDGGYRLELRPEYDRLRRRVYGSGPREVRLSQDVLEVLALVAYLQPISEKQIEEHGKQNAGNLLRQLLRRDLVAFERGPGGRKDVQYHTTPRFLSLFGLGSLDELPQAEDLAKK